MKLTRFTIKSCCGKVSNIFKTDAPLTKEFLATLVKAGFREYENFTKSGILYADNSDFRVSGPFGSDRLQVQCKKANCEQKLNDFEEFLLKLE